MARSVHDKLLRVNLTDGTIQVEQQGMVYWRRYMGGWNLIADVLLREVPAGAKPLGPDNKLIFAPGVVGGLPFSGASRCAVGARSPLTGAFGAAEMGGTWPSEFKRAGFDALIVEGVAERPVYLWLHDGVAELRDAGHLWGLATKETEAAIRRELDDRRVQCALIGPGGENQVAYACVMSGLFDAAGRAGLGAVMGSKRLKAVAVRGSQPLEAADPTTIRTMARELARAVQAGEKAKGLHQWGTGGNIQDMVLTGNLPTRNFRDGDFAEGVERISADAFMPEIGVGMEGCYGCAVRCKKIVAAETPYPVDKVYGGPEYETFAALGSCCGVDDMVAVSKASELCNAYSLDTIATGVTIALAMECFENGLLSLADTGGLDLRFGNAEAMLALVEQIARHQGLGARLAGSLTQVAEGIGGEAWRYALHVKGQPYPMHEPRHKRGLAIGYAISPTGADHCHALHDEGLGTATDEGFMSDGILRSMGQLEPVPLEDLGPAKAWATLSMTRYQVMLNCLAICLFVPWTLEEITSLVRAATGWDVSSNELAQVGERAWTLARVFNLREGFTSQDDRLAERSYGPTRNGTLADGGIDREELQEALQTTYGMLGWDAETGVPLVATLQRLGVSWAADYLPGR